MKIVGLLVESSRGYGRGLLRGVARYVRAHRGVFGAPAGGIYRLPGDNAPHQRQLSIANVPAPQQYQQCRIFSAHARSGSKPPACRPALPRPCGIMACNDICGRQVVNACRVRQIPVPEEIAVIGVDDDEVLCELADPPLTSIALPTEKIGYDAAAMLAHMMAGHAPDRMETRVDPLGVIRRLSTDIVATDSPVISKAIRYIRDHVSDGITVENVLDHLAAQGVGVSRSTLERRFTEFLGRSPKDEILHERVNRARHLLLETTYPLGQIARLVGLRRTEQLISLFKARTGMTPGALRKTLC